MRGGERKRAQRDSARGRERDSVWFHGCDELQKPLKVLHRVCCPLRSPSLPPPPLPFFQAQLPTKPHGPGPLIGRLDTRDRQRKAYPSRSYLEHSTEHPTSDVHVGCRRVSDSSLFVHQHLGKPFQGQIIHVAPVWRPQNLHDTNAHESQVVLR